MAEGLANRVWMGRAVFAGLMLGLMFVLLLPLDTLPRGWAGPDVLLLVTLVWAVRRPDHVPVLLVGAVFLLADLLFDRPPGLWTALVVILTETMRARAEGLRRQPFPVEWMTATFGILAIMLGARAALSITLVPQAPLALTLMQIIATVLCYPVVAAAAYLLLGLNRPGPGETDARGRLL